VGGPSGITELWVVGGGAVRDQRVSAKQCLRICAKQHTGNLVGGALGMIVCVWLVVGGRGSAHTADLFRQENVC
jgi:formate/nitrite transporter FocA (FNT family)